MPQADFPAWLPDQPEIGAPPHLRVALNVTPRANGYGPVQALTATTDALTARCIGMIAVRDKDNAAHMYAGDTDDLYELETATWTNRSNGSGYTTAGSTTRWRFAAYGDRLIAVNGLDAPQYIDMSTAATAFADLPGSPGAASFVAVYGEFVFLGRIATSGMAIKWSALGDSEGWTPGVGLSDEQEFADGGAITGMIATKSALYVFQEKCVRRVYFVGGDAIMQIDKLFDAIGCIEPNSLVSYGQRCFFLSEDGWYEWDFESQPRPIGFEKFDKWFLADSQRDYWYAMTAVIDPKNRVFVCGYAAGASDLPDSLLIYSYELGRAAYARVTHELLAPSISTFTSIDDLVGNLDTDYSVSFDDPFWSGGAFYFAAFTSDHKLSSFGGANLEATLTQSLAPLYDGRRCAPQWVKPVTDASGATCAVGYKVRPSDAVAYTTAASMQASGRCPQRNANGFYHGARVVIPAGEVWTYVRGVEFAPGNARGVR